MTRTTLSIRNNAAIRVWWNPRFSITRVRHRSGPHELRAVGGRVGARPMSEAWDPQLVTSGWGLLWDVKIPYGKCFAHRFASPMRGPARRRDPRGARLPTLTWWSVRTGKNGPNQWDPQATERVATGR
ncbi:hypothetical protein GW17_00008060 [Ensete ventricosum]|nr:hypothetical protein GW17_00008060 [Ensete ventricosum]